MCKSTRIKWPSSIAMFVYQRVGDSDISSTEAFLTSGGPPAAADATAADGRRRRKSHQRAHSTPGGAAV